MWVISDVRKTHSMYTCIQYVYMCVVYVGGKERTES